MTRKLIIIFFFFLTAVITAQEVTFNQVKEEYEAFEYEKVINLSNELIKQGGISDSLKIEVYLMRVVSFYSIGDESSTQNSFREILKINNNFIPDPSKISPRLITIFENVKTDFIKSLKPEPATKDTTDQTRKYLTDPSFKTAILKNIFVPGWGQLSNNSGTKGYLLTAASSINLAAMIYFIFDSNKKEKDYINEINRNLIQTKYDSFNSSYKTRNVLITSYILIWIYSQIDLLIFNGSDEVLTGGVEERVTFSGERGNLNLNFKIPIRF